jgi:trans-aconitate methyltransferase
VTQAAVAVDWANWFERWERQQEAHIPYREERFTAMLDLLAMRLPEDFVAVDLACGPGAITRRLLARFPKARVVAVDLDPVLLAMGRAVVGDGDGRARFADGNLIEPDWLDSLGVPAVDAVLSTTAIHWLPPGAIVQLYRTLAGLIRPGGVFMNGDNMQFVEAEPGLREAAQRARDAHLAGALRGGAESWDAWWEALRAEPGLASLFADRDRLFSWRNASPPGLGGKAPAPAKPVTYAMHRAALLDAGFAEVGTIWQHFGNRVIAAIR